MAPATWRLRPRSQATPDLMLRVGGEWLRRHRKPSDISRQNQATSVQGDLHMDKLFSRFDLADQKICSMSRARPHEVCRPMPRPCPKASDVKERSCLG